jgi:MFS family permease
MLMLWEIDLEQTADWAFPALLTTVPYGLLADRYGPPPVLVTSSDLFRSGRKLVFVLSLTGIILSACWSFTVMWFWKILPVRLAWLCPLFTFIGGGQAVAAMMFFAVASDVTTDSNR